MCEQTTKKKVKRRKHLKNNWAFYSPPEMREEDGHFSCMRKKVSGATNDIFQTLAGNACYILVKRTSLIQS